MKKFCCILITLLLFASFITVYAGASDEDEPEFPCGGVIEGVEIEILYSPLSSRILIGDYKPDFEGTVFLITYPNGEKEILTAEKKDGVCYAGNFKVYIYYRFDEAPPEYGFVEETLSLYYDKSHGGYSGYADFVYLYLPSFEDIPDIVSSYFCKQQSIWF